VKRRQVLQDARKLLARHHIESASLTAEVLLRYALTLTRVRFYQEPDKELTPEQATAFKELLERHLKGEPVAYLTGNKEFYGLDFTVDSRVLIPRPETELLVAKAITLATDDNMTTVADIGTGSGAIAVALAVNLPDVKIFATDISEAALEAARRNCRRYNVENRITLLPGDLLSPLPTPVDLITANLPYVRTADLNENSIRYEPRPALDGGPDGLDLLRRFIPRVKDKLRNGGTVLLEIGQYQDEMVTSLIKTSYPGAEIQVYKDYAAIKRVICARFPG
jgi:release factor glutamine methyltransferase